MRIVIFCHSLLSDWNHGNAHFLRGICSELIARGHQVCAYEPRDAWSLENLRRDAGDAPLEAFSATYPQLSSTQYDSRTIDIGRVVSTADLVLVHEWNDPALVAAVGEARTRSNRFRLLFHDTHHRSVTDPESMSQYDLRHYDGALVFGASIADVYRQRGWARNVWVWHEAADTRVFHPVDEHVPKSVTSFGSVTGAMTNARPNWKSFFSSQYGHSTSKRRSMVSDIRSRRSQPSALGHRIWRVDAEIRRHPGFLPVTGSQSTFRVVRM